MLLTELSDHICETVETEETVAQPQAERKGEGWRAIIQHYRLRLLTKAAEAATRTMISVFGPLSHAEMVGRDKTDKIILYSLPERQTANSRRDQSCVNKPIQQAHCCGRYGNQVSYCFMAVSLVLTDAYVNY